MSDKMMFPENIDDFLSGFAFKDSEGIYTNGSMLIPLFRVQQAFEHYSTEIRNKAINDFAEKLKEICSNHSVGADSKNHNELLYAHKDGTWHSLIDDVAEQLKAGDNNG